MLTLWLLTSVTFLLGHLAPGSPVDIILGQHSAPETRRQLEREYGLDQPLPRQYWRYLSGVARGDFGESFRYRRPVRAVIRERYPETLKLAVTAMVLAVLLGAPLGLLAAVKQHGWADRLAVGTALIGVSLPTFVIGPLLILIFAQWLGWVPVAYGGRWAELLLPALTLGARPAALIARLTRASFVDALRQDYVRTARAKGAGAARALLAHAGRNALLPVLTVIGTSFGYLLSGSFVVETIFAVQGLGFISIASIGFRDYPVIQAVTLLAAAVFIAVNLLVDLAYGILDPRLRVARAGA